MEFFGQVIDGRETDPGEGETFDTVDPYTRRAVAERRTASVPARHTDTRKDTPMSDATTSGEEWDTWYGRSERVWSQNPNTALVDEVTDLEPGRALDLGCGEGADAVWLARRGWRVTATDISRVALDRAARHAAAADVADRIDWQYHDLGRSFPAGVFDLVSAHFLHSRSDLPREEILRAAASAVAPGGVLLVVGHAGHPSGEDDPHPDVHFPTPEKVLDGLGLADGRWEVLVSDEHQRVQTGPDGQPTTHTDYTLKVRRLTD